MFKCQGPTSYEHPSSKETPLSTLCPHRSEGSRKGESLKRTGLEILQWAISTLKHHRIENPRLNAELLLAHSLNLNREELYVRLYRELNEGEKGDLERLIQRRTSGEPLQYILGHQEFWSIQFKVDPRVLIPRPETELLVEQSLSILSERTFGRNPSVLEIGTGSGAIAVALAKEVKNIFLVATDISRDALILAKENAKSAGVQDQIQFVNGDLLNPFHSSKGREAFDLILSNPPYIIRSEIGSLAKEVRDYEPVIALDGGEDGLEFYRCLIPQVPSYLRKGGWLLLEVGQGQAERVAKQIQGSGTFLELHILPDLAGIGRVVKAQKMESRK
jgi:release factor glutamine methyltransferase